MILVKVSEDAYVDPRCVTGLYISAAPNMGWFLYLGYDDGKVRTVNKLPSYSEAQQELDRVAKLLVDAVNEYLSPMKDD